MTTLAKQKDISFQMKGLDVSTNQLYLHKYYIYEDMKTTLPPGSTSDSMSGFGAVWQVLQRLERCRPNEGACFPRGATQTDQIVPLGSGECGCD